jgi:hypothetical protein
VGIGICTRETGNEAPAVARGEKLSDDLKAQISAKADSILTISRGRG